MDCLNNECGMYSECVGMTFDRATCGAYKPLIANKEPVAEVPCSDGLSDLADAWDKAAEHYSVEAEKQPTTYLKGIRAGASYKLESCANELRALIKEAGR